MHIWSKKMYKSVIDKIDLFCYNRIKKGREDGSVQADVCVTEILNVYQNDTLTWSRRKPTERNRNGLVLFMEGEIEYYFPDKTIVASAGSVMLFPSNVPYHGVARTQRVAYYVLDFQTLSENEICDFGAPCIAKLKSFDTVCRDFSNVVSVWGQQKMDAVIRTKAFLYSMLALLMENEGRSSLKQERDDIFTYIFDHYTDPDISVLSLCEKFYISESQLRRNALKVTGLTTNEYITFLRLTRAKRELICTQKSIKQIAYECGFSSAYYFSRSFHLHEKVSPKEYRQNSVML